jgi:acyl-CoA reductase-like NAD-dependent aldehyde dehydrogenase
MKQPLGVIVYVQLTPLADFSIISPWNYPLTCIINSLIPALLAGNSVILKPAPQAPKSAETICAAFTAAGLPEGVLQVLHADRQETLAMVADKRVAHVVCTGSVEGGRAIARAVAAGESFASVGLELGGKDPAYVRADADVEAAAVSLVDGESYHMTVRAVHSFVIILTYTASMFNTGQSCKSLSSPSRPSEFC